MQQNLTNNPQALQAIYHAGGHFVLCLEDKRPVWRSWQKLRPGLDVVLAHEGPLGLKPWSISTSALDVDAGDPGALIEAWPPMAVLDSRRADGKHLYYSDTAGRGNAHFEAYGCAGEVRSAKGYLILWHDGAGRLADALDDPIAQARRWPRDLFELAGLPAVTLPGAVKSPVYRYKPSDQSRQTWAAAAAGLELETIKRGFRNVRLFDAVRFWAYSVPRGDALEAWTRRVRGARPRAEPPLPAAARGARGDPNGLQHFHLVLVRRRSQMALRPFQRHAEAAGAEVGQDAAGQERRQGPGDCGGCPGRAEHEGGRQGVGSD